MTVPRTEPPALACALLARVLPEGTLGLSILGDLYEEFDERALLGPARARHWFWRSALGLGGRYAARRLGALFLGQRQRCAVVDRRQPAAEQDLALELEFLLGFVCGIDPARIAQLGKGRLIGIEPCRLTLLACGLNPQPFEVRADRLDIFLAAALGIGVVDAQDELAPCFAGEHPIVERSADIADMQPARGRRGETRYYHGASR